MAIRFFLVCHKNKLNMDQAVITLNINKQMGLFSNVGILFWPDILPNLSFPDDLDCVFSYYLRIRGQIGFCFFFLMLVFINYLGAANLQNFVRT